MLSSAHQTETGEQEGELKKLRKQLDRQRPNADKQFRKLRQAAPADNDSDRIRTTITTASAMHSSDSTTVTVLSTADAVHSLTVTAHRVGCKTRAVAISG